MPPAEGEEIGVFWAQEVAINIDGEERQLLDHTGSDPGAISMIFFDPVSERGIALVGSGDDGEISDTSFETLIEALFVSAGQLNQAPR